MRIVIFTFCLLCLLCPQETFAEETLQEKKQVRLALADVLKGKKKERLPLDYAPNAVFLELGGPGLFYSVNYERRLPIPVVLRLGFSLFRVGEGESGDGIGYFTVPLSASYLLSWGSHHLELGLGLVWGYAWSALNKRKGAPLDDYWHMAGSLQLGYRYQPVGSGFVFRATFTPMYGGRRFDAIGRYVQWWGGISAGWSF